MAWYNVYRLVKFYLLNEIEAIDMCQTTEKIFRFVFYVVHLRFEAYQLRTFIESGAI